MFRRYLCVSIDPPINELKMFDKKIYITNIFSNISILVMAGARSFIFGDPCRPFCGHCARGVRKTVDATNLEERKKI